MDKALTIPVLVLSVSCPSAMTTQITFQVKASRLAHLIAEQTAFVTRQVLLHLCMVSGLFLSATAMPWPARCKAYVDVWANPALPQLQSTV